MLTEPQRATWDRSAGLGPGPQPVSDAASPADSAAAEPAAAGPHMEEEQVAAISGEASPPDDVAGPETESDEQLSTAGESDPTASDVDTAIAADEMAELPRRTTGRS